MKIYPTVLFILFLMNLFADEYRVGDHELMLKTI